MCVHCEELYSDIKKYIQNANERGDHNMASNYKAILDRHIKNGTGICVDDLKENEQTSFDFAEIDPTVESRPDDFPGIDPAVIPDYTGWVRYKTKDWNDSDKVKEAYEEMVITGTGIMTFEDPWECEHDPYEYLGLNIKELRCKKCDKLLK